MLRNAILQESDALATDARAIDSTVAISAATRATPNLNCCPIWSNRQRTPEQAKEVEALALPIVGGGVRERSRASRRAGLVQGLPQEVALSSQEGVAPMCLAEALLRIPDAATGNTLVRDKLRGRETVVPLERLLIERSLSISTAATGGNASLMTIG